MKTICLNLLPKMSILQLLISVVITKRITDLSKVLWQESPPIAGEAAIPFQHQGFKVSLFFRKIILAMILRPTRSTELGQITTTLAPIAEAFHLKVLDFSTLPMWSFFSCNIGLCAFRPLLSRPLHKQPCPAPQMRWGQVLHVPFLKQCFHLHALEGTRMQSMPTTITPSANPAFVNAQRQASCRVYACRQHHKQGCIPGMEA